MANLWGREYTKTEILRRVGDLSQIAGAQAFELVDGNRRGVRGVRLYNAAGLDVTCLTDRGMALTDVHFHGVPLVFLTAVGPVHPAFSEPAGLGWLRTWPGGFLTPCGLTQVGSPNEDQGEQLGQHGRAASIPAQNVAWGETWEGDTCQIWVQGALREAAVFGADVRLTRRIWTELDSPCLWIEDFIENLGFGPAPLMLLQHVNLGFPLVGPGARLELPEHTTWPRDADAQDGLARCLEFEEPQPGYREQVFYHDLAPDADGRVSARLVNPHAFGGKGLGVELRYAKSAYPNLVEWKMMGEGMYAVGLEPANCHVHGRSWERQNGTLQELAPQETRRFELEIAFLGRE